MVHYATTNLCQIQITYEKMKGKKDSIRSQYQIQIQTNKHISNEARQTEEKNGQ